MKREELSELHYITPIANVPSILKRGILSHNRVKKVLHDSVAMAEIQDRRMNKRIPGAGKLHDYVNLYFDAHNPMLSKVRAHNNMICVLRVTTSALDLPNVIVSDRNASSGYANFMTVDDVGRLSRERIFARYWTHPEDPIEEMRHRSEKCAEVLVPDKLSSDLIVGAYVADQTALKNWNKLRIELRATINQRLFF